MSIGQVIGGIVGGVAGFFVGGPMGAVYGAGIGMGVGTLLSPMPYTMPDAGKPDLNDLSVTKAEEGSVIPDVLGITKVGGNIVHYWGNRIEKIYEEVGGGKGGKGGGAQNLVDVKYFLSWFQVICQGPVDNLFAIYSGDSLIWYGSLPCPVSGGVETVTTMDISADGTYSTETSSYTGVTVSTGTVFGNIHFYFGTEDQAPPIGAITSLGENQNIPYRGLCYAYFDDFFIGAFNRAPIIKFIVGKTPVLPFNLNNIITTYDYNPAHAIWWILEKMASIPAELIDEVSFSDCANVLLSEGIGANILFDKEMSSISYINNVLFAFDMMMYYDTDGKIHLRLLRETE